MDRDLESAFREDYSSLCRYVYRIIADPEDAAEIVQETFLRFHRMRAKCGQACDRVLLYRVARNLAIDCLRRRQTRKRHHDAETRILEMPTVESTEDTLMGQELRDQLQIALRSLKPKEAEAVILRYEGHSYGDIALILEIQPNSVGPMITRGLGKLREAWAAISDGSELTVRIAPATDAPAERKSRPGTRTRSAG